MCIRDRQGPGAHELHAIVLRRVVRGGDHGAAVEASRGDAEIQHLRGHEAEVDRAGAAGGGAGRERLEQTGGRRARVHARAEPSRAELLRQGAADALSGLLVDLLRVQPAHVVRLEDVVRDRHQPSLPRSCSWNWIELSGRVVSGYTQMPPCLLYTSDAADDLTRVDLGGR